MQAAEEVASETKEAKIEEIQSKISWIKENLSGNTPIHEIFASSSPKRDLILKWAQYLEDLAKLQVYKKPLSTISTHITAELRELKLFKSISYVRGTLPNKYKDEDKDHSEDDDLEVRENDSRENSSNYLKENKPYIKRLLKTAELLDAAAQKLEKHPLMSKLDPRVIEEYFVRWDNSLQQLADVLDGREKVPFSKQSIFMYCCSLATGNHIYAEFVKYIRDFAKFTSKQAGKIIEGRVTNLTLLYEPKNRIEAVRDGFYGFPCEWCGSWRVKTVRRKKNNVLVLNCFHCGEDTPLKTEKLPEN